MNLHFLTFGLAYLDPGSGSFILQLLIAALVGGLFLVKTYWAKIRTYIGKVFGRETEDKESE